MANEHNLKPFKKGYDSRRGYKPKGTKHFSTHIQQMLHDKNFTVELEDGSIFKGKPIAAILTVLAAKAIGGDIRAIAFLAKHGYGTTVTIRQEDLEVRRGMSLEEINSVLARANEYKRELEGPPVPPMTSHQLEQLARLRREEEELEIREQASGT